MLRLNPFTVSFLGWNDVNGGQQRNSCRVLTWSLFCNQRDISVTGLWIRVSPSNELGQKSAVILLGLRFSHRHSQRSRLRSRAVRSCRNFPIRFEVFPQSHSADQEEPPANPFSRSPLLEKVREDVLKLLDIIIIAGSVQRTKWDFWASPTLLLLCGSQRRRDVWGIRVIHTDIPSSRRVRTSYCDPGIAEVGKYCISSSTNGLYTRIRAKPGFTENLDRFNLSLSLSSYSSFKENLRGNALLFCPNNIINNSVFYSN